MPSGFRRAARYQPKYKSFAVRVTIVCLQCVSVRYTIWESAGLTVQSVRSVRSCLRGLDIRQGIHSLIPHSELHLCTMPRHPRSVMSSIDSRWGSCTTSQRSCHWVASSSVGCTSASEPKWGTLSGRWSACNEITHCICRLHYHTLKWLFRSVSTMGEPHLPHTLRKRHYWPKRSTCRPPSPNHSRRSSASSNCNSVIEPFPVVSSLSFHIETRSLMTPWRFG